MQIYVNEKNHHMDIVLNSNCILSQFMFFTLLFQAFFYIGIQHKHGKTILSHYLTI
jgi:hypothetical protein